MHKNIQMVHEEIFMNLIVPLMAPDGKIKLFVTMTVICGITSTNPLLLVKADNRGFE